MENRGETSVALYEASSNGPTSINSSLIKKEFDTLNIDLPDPRKQISFSRKQSFKKMIHDKIKKFSLIALSRPLPFRLPLAGTLPTPQGCLPQRKT
jgi:hypothetical protein